MQAKVVKVVIQLLVCFHAATWTWNSDSTGRYNTSRQVLMMWLWKDETQHLPVHVRTVKDSVSAACNSSAAYMPFFIHQLLRSWSHSQLFKYEYRVHTFMSHLMSTDNYDVKILNNLLTILSLVIGDLFIFCRIKWVSSPMIMLCKYVT